ncbi:MAG TPA: PatB family C-S lyase [Methylomirabilota bacterium]|jgi:cystathionine beta-lyase|nr:PatB family C-S lyase [Methylomirabilota bacterium]
MTFDFDKVVNRRGTDSNKWNKYGPDVLPLWVADMDFASPPAVVEALWARVEHGIFGYLREGAPELVEVFTERCRKRYGWDVPRDAIMLAPGVNPANNVAARAACEPGDGFVILTPAYPPLLRVPGNVGLEAQLPVLAHRADGGYEIDFDAFERAITPKTRAFLLCNPHNPVGRVYTRAELSRLAEICLRHRLTIVADEIHCDLLYTGHEHVPMASLGPEVAMHTITMMAPSKTFNQAGLKASVAVVTDPVLRERFQNARKDMVQPTANVMGYTAMVAAYRDGGPWHEALLRYLEANRDYLADYVSRHLSGVMMAKPEGTYLAWLDCRPAGIADPFTFFLEKARVAFNDGKLFGAPGDGFVRLNFGTPRVLLTEGLERMRRALVAR